MSKTIYVNTLIAGVTLILSGCATLFSGTSEEITISASPDSATIFLNDRVVGTGNVTLDVPREYADAQRPMIKVIAEGYQAQEFKMSTKFNNTSIINLSSVHSWTTDFLSGAMFEYAPNKYHVQLLKEGSVGAPPSKYKLERFVLSNYDLIISDLSRGHGEYFGTLVGFARNSELAANALYVNKNSLLASSSPIDLSGKLSKLLLEN